jgi:hypothetical protein
MALKFKADAVTTIGFGMMQMTGTAVHSFQGGVGIPVIVGAIRLHGSFNCTHWYVQVAYFLSHIAIGTTVSILLLRFPPYLLTCTVLVFNGQSLVVGPERRLSSGYTCRRWLHCKQ